MGGQRTFFAGIQTAGRVTLRLSFLLCLLALQGCGLFGKGSQLDALDEPLHLQGEPVRYSTTIDVEQPVPAIPAAGASGSGPEAGPDAAPSSDYESPAGPAGPEALPPPQDPAALAEELKKRMEESSQLIQLTGDAPDSLLGLERRAGTDRKTAISLLHSLGFYDGRADLNIKRDASPMEVILALYPGCQYMVGEVNIKYAPAPLVPPEFQNRTRQTGLFFRKTVDVPPPSFPTRLSGVKPGDPAVADTMLDAVANLPERLHRRGYPQAAVVSTRYTLNKAARTLNADITVDAGAPALLGPLLVSGTDRIEPAYLRRLVPWREGTPWNASTLANFRETLQQLGLFSVVDINPAYEQSDGAGPGHARVVPVALRVAESAPRTIGAEANYATDTGFGVEGNWEHRNLLGQGELLRVEAPVGQDLQALIADFSKPAFYGRNQKLLAGSSLQRERTDAYTNSFANAYVGLERRLTPRWAGNLRFFFETGNLEENDVKNSYRFLSLRANLKRDTRNNPINARRGSLVDLSLTPYYGWYIDPFHAVAAQVDLRYYYAPFRSDRLVLAARGAVGMMLGSGSGDLPASIRYYAGGGGSVRGYAYQSLGPRDDRNEPAGGRSFNLFNLEARFKITESLGLVPFIDGGMVYDRQFPGWARDLYYGVGLGIRYDTSIGPVRLDLGVPLRKIRGEDPVQLYISIGQAF